MESKQRESPDELHIEHQPHFHFVKQSGKHFLADHKPHKPRPSCLEKSTIMPFMFTLAIQKRKGKNDENYIYILQHKVTLSIIA